MSMNPGRASYILKGLPTKSLFTSPLLSRKPSSPSRSILPAQTLQWMGRSGRELRTSPRMMAMVATTVSIAMSMGREGAAGDDDMRVAAVARKDWRAVCSCAE